MTKNKKPTVAVAVAPTERRSCRFCVGSAGYCDQCGGWGSSFEELMIQYRLKKG